MRLFGQPFDEGVDVFIEGAGVLVEVQLLDGRLPLFVGWHQERHGFGVLGFFRLKVKINNKRIATSSRLGCDSFSRVYNFMYAGLVYYIGF